MVVVVDVVTYCSAKKFAAELEDDVVLTVLIVNRQIFVVVTFAAPIFDIVIASLVFVSVLHLDLIVALAFVVVAVYVIDVLVAGDVALLHFIVFLAEVAVLTLIGVNDYQIDFNVGLLDFSFLEEILT